MKFINIFLSAILFSLLSACGGGSSDSPSVAMTDANKTLPFPPSTGNPYLPMVSGTYIRYTIQEIESAHIDSQTNAVLVDSYSSTPNPRGQYLTQQFTTHTCPSLPGQMFYALQWNFSNDGLPVAPSTSNSTTLWISNYTVNGVSYWGEGDGGNITPGEAIISSNPIAGESVNIDSVVLTADGNGCTTPTVANPDFRTTYKTVEHLDSWNGWNDVWTSTLVEWTGDNPPRPTYYQWWYARDIGMIGQTCWRPEGGNDYYDCGNMYIATYEGPIQ